MDNHTSMAGLRNIMKKNVFCFQNEKFVQVSEVSEKTNGIKRVIIGTPLQSNFDGKINSLGHAEYILDRFREQFKEIMSLGNAKIVKILDN